MILSTYDNHLKKKKKKKKKKQRYPWVINTHTIDMIILYNILG